MTFVGSGILITGSTGLGQSENLLRGLTSDGTYLYALGNSIRRLIRINSLTTFDAEAVSAQTPQQVNSLAYLDGSFYFATNSSSTLYKIDPPFSLITENTELGQIDGTIRSLCTDGTNLFAYDRANSILRQVVDNGTTVDTLTVTEFATIDFPSGVSDTVVAMFYFGNAFYLFNNNDDKMYKLPDNLVAGSTGVVPVVVNAAITGYDVSDVAAGGAGTLGDEAYFLGDTTNSLYRLYRIRWDATIDNIEVDAGADTTFALGSVSQDALGFSFAPTNTARSWLTIVGNDLTIISAPDDALDTDYSVIVRATRSGINVDETLTVRVIGTGVTTTVPSAPTSLSVTTTRTTAVLAWTAPTDDGGTPITEYQYRYQEGSTAGGAWTDTNSTAVTFTISNLDPSTEYTFQVRAVNSTGNSAASSAVTESTLTTVPGAPTGLSATAQAGGTSVELDWTAPTNNGGSTIIDYEVSSDDGGTWNSTGSATTSYTVTGLDKGTEYVFRVRAVNSPHGDGDASVSVTETTLTTVPASPTSLSVTTTRTTADLSWVAPTDTGGSPITEYQYRFIAGTTAGGTWTDTDSTDPNFIITSLSADTEYTFQVRTLTSVGNSQGNPSVTETTLSESAPSAPQNLRATAQTGGVSMALTWTVPIDNGGANITDYEVSSDNGSTWNSTGGTTLSYTVTGLDKGTEYVFRVRAINSVGNGTASASDTETTLTTRPDPVTSLTGTADSNGTEMDLAWVAPADDGGSAITEYQYRFTTGTSIGGTWTDTNSTAPSVTITALDKGTQYTFQVRVITSVGNSQGNPFVTETTATTIPGAPTGLSETVGGTTATLSWAAPTDDGGSTITDYEVRYAQGTTIPNGTAWVSTGSATSTSYSLSMLTSATGYAFQVRAINLIGNGTASATRTFTTSVALSIEVLDAQALTLNTDYDIEIEIVGEPEEVTAEGKWDGWYYDWDADTDLLTISGNANAVLSDATWALTATKGTESVEEDVDYSVAPPAPVITEPANLIITAGTDYDNTPITIAIANSPAVVRMEGLLVGLYFESTDTGVEIKGMLPSDVELTVTSGTLEIYASNGGGEDTVTPTFTIN